MNQQRQSNRMLLLAITFATGIESWEIHGRGSDLIPALNTGSVSTSTIRESNTSLTTASKAPVELQASQAARWCPSGSLFQALSAIESGDDDYAVGSSGEVSRYQIMRSVWRQYGKGLNPKNPAHAKSVALKILSDRSNAFALRHNRLPSNRELYGLWNAPAQTMKLAMSHRVTERAVRFESLVNH
jgi:hypothetical protein